MKQSSFLVLVVALLLVVGGSPTRAVAQPNSSGQRQAPVFPDEFSDLDEGNSGVSVGAFGRTTTDQLDRARQKYLMALEAIEKGNKSIASKHFDESISILNALADEPEITKDRDYTELVQAIVEDYESYITNIDDLSTDTPIFILRGKMYTEVDAKPAVEPITVVKTTPRTGPVATQIPLTSHESVDDNLKFLTQAKGRKFFKRWLERSGRWFPTLQRIAAEEDMPPEIIYLAMMESGLNPNAVSPAKAVGMWQFIQSTGRMYDLRIDTWIDERRDVEKATRASMRFLKDLYNDLGDWQLALAAYNCGPGGVRRARRRAGMESGDFWQVRHKLPRETRNYVPLYIATTMITMNPEKYGFPKDSLTFEPPYAYATYVVDEPVNLTALAKCAGISTDSLKALNPELRRECTPPDMEYRLKIPVGSTVQFGQRFALLTDDEKTPWIEHTVRRRETLAKIARQYGVSAGDLAAINDISGYRHGVRRGQRLRIPIVNQGEAVDVASAGESQEEPQEEVKTTKAPEPGPVAKAVAPAKRSEKHVVQSGESLGSIASRYGVSVSDLREWNQIDGRNGVIHPGDELVVNVTDRPTTTAKVERIPITKVVRHKVRRGDNLTEIAERYGTTVDRIRELNGMSRRSTLKAGRSLKVETTTTVSRQLAEAKPAKNSRTSSTPKTYKVRRGDTLSMIADKFGMSISELRRANPSLKNSDNIRVGQKIRLQ